MSIVLLLLLLLLLLLNECHQKAISTRTNSIFTFLHTFRFATALAVIMQCGNFNNRTSKQAAAA